MERKTEGDLRGNGGSAQNSSHPSPNRDHAAIENGQETPALQDMPLRDSPPEVPVAQCSIPVLDSDDSSDAEEEEPVESGRLLNVSVSSDQYDTRAVRDVRRLLDTARIVLVDLFVATVEEAAHDEIHSSESNRNESIEESPEEGNNDLVSSVHSEATPALEQDAYGGQCEPDQFPENEESVTDLNTELENLKLSGDDLISPVTDFALEVPAQVHSSLEQLLPIHEMRDLSISASGGATPFREVGIMERKTEGDLRCNGGSGQNSSHPSPNRDHAAIENGQETPALQDMPLRDSPPEVPVAQCPIPVLDSDDSSDAEEEEPVESGKLLNVSVSSDQNDTRAVRDVRRLLDTARIVLVDLFVATVEEAAHDEIQSSESNRNESIEESPEEGNNDLVSSVHSEATPTLQQDEYGGQREPDDQFPENKESVTDLNTELENLKLSGDDLISPVTDFALELLAQVHSSLEQLLPIPEMRDLSISASAGATPFREVGAKLAKTSRSIPKEAITDVKVENWNLSEPDGHKIQSSGVNADPTKTSKAKRVLRFDAFDIHETDCLTEAVKDSEKHAIKEAVPKPSECREPIRADLEKPPTGELESPEPCQKTPEKSDVGLEPIAQVCEPYKFASPGVSEFQFKYFGALKVISQGCSPRKIANQLMYEFKAKPAPRLLKSGIRGVSHASNTASLVSKKVVMRRGPVAKMDVRSPVRFRANVFAPTAGTSSVGSPIKYMSQGVGFSSGRHNRCRLNAQRRVQSLPPLPCEDCVEEELARYRQSVRNEGMKSRKRLFTPERVSRETVETIRAMFCDPVNCKTASPVSKPVRSHSLERLSTSEDNLDSIKPLDPEVNESQIPHHIGYQTPPEDTKSVAGNYFIVG